MSLEQGLAVTPTVPANYLAAAICDWDGMLVDSLPAHYAFQRQICHLTGKRWPITDFDDYRAKMIEPFPLFYQHVLGFDWERDKAWIHAQYKEFMAGQDYQFRHGAISLLAQVFSVGLPIGIASQSSVQIIQEKLRKRQALDLVKSNAIIGAEAGLPLKPDPAALLESASKLNVPPANCVYIGDMPTDILAAKAAGMSAVAVLGGFSTEEKLRAANPDAIASTPFEAFRFIKGRIPQESLDLSHIP